MYPSTIIVVKCKQGEIKEIIKLKDKDNVSEIVPMLEIDSFTLSSGFNDFDTILDQHEERNMEDSVIWNMAEKVIKNWGRYGLNGDIIVFHKKLCEYVSRESYFGSAWRYLYSFRLVGRIADPKPNPAANKVFLLWLAS